MSTILDALRKVERERDPSSEATLDAPTISSEPRRRSFPIGTILVCAIIGFGGGAVLSWWMPASETEVQVAALPEPPPPPDISVPRPPLRAKPAAPAAPVQDQVAVVPPPAAPAAAPAPPPVEAAQAVVPRVVGNDRVPTQPSSAALPKGASPDPGPAVAAIDPEASALEPSPFKPSREPAIPQENEVTKSSPPEPARAPERREPQDLAALAPEVPMEPDVLEAEEAMIEPEPEASPENLVDTGRSPPGAPKVALSFLQWSADPARRFAFISVDGAPTQRIREGEVAAGLTVAAITPTGVQFKREGTIFVIRPRH